MISTVSCKLSWHIITKMYASRAEKDTRRNSCLEEGSIMAYNGILEV